MAKRDLQRQEDDDEPEFVGGNLAAAIRKIKVSPDDITDATIRSLVLNLVLDQAPDVGEFANRAKVQLDGLKFLHEMNHPKGEVGGSGEALFVAWRDAGQRPVEADDDDD